MELWKRAREWLSIALRPEKEDADLAEEIRFHLDMDVQRSISRGLSRMDAIALAERRFGNVDRVRQRARDQRKGLNPGEIMRDIKYALRSFLRTPGFTFVALVTLALGIGATTIAFTLVNSVLLKPLPYRESDRLVLISELDKGGERMWPSYPNFIDWRNQSHAFDGVASLMFPFGASARGTGDVERIRIMGVSNAFFRVLGVTPALGREFLPEESASRDGAMRVVMVTHDYWMNQLGGEPDLARIRMSANDAPVTVVGVLPAGFEFSVKADIFFPHEIWPGTIRNAHNYMVVGRLRKGTTIESARSEMSQITSRLKTEYGDDEQAVAAQVVPLREFMVGDQRPLLIMLLGAAALVLLIACVNLVSAQLARGTVRQRDLSVRAALGASRRQLVAQLLTESVVLSASGAVAGILLASVVLGAVRAVGAGMIPRLGEVTTDARVLLFTIATAVLSVLITGVYPALRLSGDSIRALGARGVQAGNHGRSRVWSLLVGAEVAIAVVLLIGSGLLIRSMHNILSMDPGFETSGLLTVSMTPGSEQTVEQLQQIERAVDALPGVVGAGMINVLPLQWGNWYGPVLREQDPPAKWPAMAGFRVVSPTYFETLRLPVIRGRGITTADRVGSARVMVITKPLADRLWPGEDPIGKKLKTNYVYDTLMTVVGLVPEAQNWKDVGAAQNEIYVPLAQNATVRVSQVSLVVRTSMDPAQLVPQVRARMHELAPDMPVEFQTMTARIEDTAKDRRFAMMVLAGFASIALVLSAVGIYGVVSYSVAVRTREIGVRMALGATSSSVLQETVGRAAVTAGIGVIFGLLAGAAASGVLRGLLFGVAALDPTTFLTGSVVLLATAVLAAFVPAFRSSRTDPLVALRSE
jgi:predicted permease